MPVPGTPSRWESTPALVESLPICFSDGTTAPPIQISCAGCSHQLDQRRQRGTVSCLAPDEFQVTGLAACMHCRGLTPFNYRLRCVQGEVLLEWKQGTQILRRSSARNLWHGVWRRLFDRDGVDSSF